MAILVATADGVEALTGAAADAAAAPSRQAIEATLARLIADHDRAAAELTVVLCDDASIAQLHQDYLQIAGPTDVLSFPMDEDDDLGEVYVGLEEAARQAAAHGHAAAEEALLYAVHGTLHLLGYDDHGDDDRARMRDAERRYAGRDGDDAPAPAPVG